MRCKGITVDALRPRPASYYYERCFILHFILEPWSFILPPKLKGFFQKRSRKSADKSEDQESKSKLFFAYVRFLLVLTA